MTWMRSTSSSWARLLWSHALQIAAAGIAAAVICLLVCTFVLTPRYQASVNLIVNSRQDGNASITSDNINSARKSPSTLMQSSSRATSS